ncbi:MAG: hypothetical protein IJ802_03565, partial [Kiritimatiellae bacterium]|nr:hypothetical protein [Kiritimatiellia bacterium]
MRTILLDVACVLCVGLAAAEIEIAPGRIEPVNDAVVRFERKGEARLQLPSAEWSCGIKFLPPTGRDTFDFSTAKYLALDVENLSDDRQLRLTMHLSAGGGGDSGDHASAIFAKKRSINTGIGLNPGEKGTMKILLPHPEIYLAPENARGLYAIDTKHIDPVELKVQWPFENQFKWVVDCRISNVRLEGEPDATRKVEAGNYCPFIDKYGQFKHDTWKFKVSRDSEFAEDLKRENAALKPAPDSWDRFGGWNAGPQLEATGHFRTAKVDGKWYLVTPEGHLFFSLGIDVVRTMTDIGDAAKHPDWYDFPVNRSYHKTDFTLQNLEKKFGKKDFVQDYYDFVLRRFDSWGINTIGNWSANELATSGRKPYVISVLENAKGVKMINGNGVRFYDVDEPEFAAKMRTAIRQRFIDEPALRRAARDPMCIGFFIDNELKFPGERGKMEKYFRVCRDALKEIAPKKLYLGCRVIGFRQSSELWAAAAKYCDVVTVNSYANSIFNIPSGIYSAAEEEKPILVGEFHFGCFDRGMFKASLCPVWSQEERARSFTRFVQGALCHPLIVGCHWFQYRDQPLLGRGDGEAYEIGFVDVCDRPYPELCRAARRVGANMYEYRKRGLLVDDMKVHKIVLSRPLSPHPRLWGRIDSERTQCGYSIDLPNDLLERKMEGRRLLETAREAVRRIVWLSAAFLYRNDDKAGERAIAEMLNICAWDDWNTEHFLDTAEIAFALGAGYDALYGKMSPEERDLIADALHDKALMPALRQTRWTWWKTAEGNWNQVCHGGIGVAALAIADRYPDDAAMFIGESAAYIPAALSVYAPCGAYP